MYPQHSPQECGQPIKASTCIQTSRCIHANRLINLGNNKTHIGESVAKRGSAEPRAERLGGLCPPSYIAPFGCYVLRPVGDLEFVRCRRRIFWHFWGCKFFARNLSESERRNFLVLILDSARVLSQIFEYTGCAVSKLLSVKVDFSAISVVLRFRSQIAIFSI